MRILLALLLSASSLCAQADYSTLLLLNNATAPCTTSVDNSVGTTTTLVPSGSTANTEYTATKFTASGTATICQIDLQLSSIGTPAGDMAAAIYSHDGGGDQPASLVGSASVAVSSSGLPGTKTTVSFPSVSASITSGTTYWVVLIKTGLDAANYVNWETQSSYPIERILRDADGSGTWSSVSTTRAGQFTIYSQ